ncbi:hypothetical protein E3P92_00625 [Wallemia ichthyophaga]|uniref:Uncharacterized protein n=1 Tax=Wallemia ichthyophaga TaxID=245174 RepID=A0A4T0GSF9_WALIC|nr:hypothetical protein E3P91_00225 [Wallemia ichthyophaga]TIA78157.1 hypothetical protein E3P98_03959 [Wallemia ichthyophaga]TIA93229.1 hypothetical protein E3P97_01014 [Wallemia ichthyophaga]TIA94956.1 hypothetical protein E3P95_03959 [Wallemia ichthyophaga]TIB04532.1 hypothetical protein E3P94_00571 [Wallemia ichthyophaga]
MFSTRFIAQFTRSIHTGSKAHASAAHVVCGVCYLDTLLTSQQSKDAGTNANAHKQAIFESLGKVEFNGNKNAHTVAGH